MRDQKIGPVGGNRRGPEIQNVDHIFTESLPRCKLHNVNIVDAFPRACPLGATIGALGALQWLKDAAFSAIVRDDHDTAREIFGRYDVCDPCVDRLSPNPHIKMLRARRKQTRSAHGAKAGVADRSTTASAQAENIPADTVISARRVRRGAL